MKILVEIDKATHKGYKALAKQRKVPIRNLYAATVKDAYDTGLAATVGEVDPRKPRTDKGRRK